LRIVLSNDDGIHAQGLNLLFDALCQHHHVDIIAPDRDSSGVSQSLSLHHPLRVRTIDQFRRVVDGTPADCVNLACRGLLNDLPDVVISGINHGANLGDDVMYSGTVGAAMEGRFTARLCIAVSLTGVNHFDTAVKVVEALVDEAEHWSESCGRVLNVNVPDLPWSEIKGMKVCRLGQREIGEPIITFQCPRGQTKHWIGKAGTGYGEDFDAVAEGYVSITPLHTDLTDNASVAALRQRVEKDF